MCLSAFTETLNYPVTAKYHMKYNGIDMNLTARFADCKQFIEYQRRIIDQQKELEEYFKQLVTDNHAE